MKRRRNQLLGVVFIVLMGLLGWLAVAIYDKAFSDDVLVRLRTDRVGNQLRAQADVKVRGVPVGTVRSVRTNGQGADVLLALDPDQLYLLPRNVSARLLPKTLFGQRYVSLIIPEHPDARPLAAGVVIEQDGSQRAVELEKALRDLLPVLQAVQPQKLASALGAVSQALEGRGKPLGTTLVSLNHYLDQLNPKLPELQADIGRFADTLATYEQAGPDILDALSDLTTTSRTIAEQRQQLSELFSTLTTASNDLNGFLNANGRTFIALSDASRPTLELLARYAPEFPCLLGSVTALKPRVEQAFGVGTNQPGLHLTLTVNPSRGSGPPPGLPAGPRCPESQLVNELVGSASGVPPSSLPGWSGLLVGPLLRGTEVTLR